MVRGNKFPPYPSKPRGDVYKNYAGRCFFDYLLNVDKITGLAIGDTGISFTASKFKKVVSVGILKVTGYFEKCQTINGQNCALELKESIMIKHRYGMFT